ncbi:MAG: DUF4838 domain-containing protein [Armatimonadetes bacterium]|nr:DUF4838 domain-containing protein [Armatimonadota bacterium]
MLSLLVFAAVPAAAQLYPPMQPPFVLWVEKGRPRATIVTDSFPTDAPPPAAILNEYIEKITGTKLPVRAEPVGEGPTIYLGPRSGLPRISDARLKPRAEDTFTMFSIGRDLVLTGLNRLGTTYAVYAFLEECLGCRWFWDSDSGAYWPTSQDLRVGQVRRTESPGFRIRWIGRGTWALANRMNVGTGHPDEFKVKWFVHTFLNLVPPDKYWKTHPEYYALHGGKREDPTDRSRQVQLCTSNPEVAQVAAQTIDELVQQDPSLRMVSVDPMDSQRFCECERCRALDEPDAPYARSRSRRLLLFFNRVAALVAQRHPDLLLKSIAYHSYVAPPADPTLRVRDNVVLQFCHFECHNHPLADPSCPANRDFNRYLLGWRNIARNVMMYEYYYKVSWLHLPWPIVHSLRRDIPYLHEHGIMGVASQYTWNFASNGLAYYVAAKLLWDSSLDVDALLEDFYQKAYAEAAGPMKEYHELLEDAAVKSGLHLAAQRPYAEAVKLFTPELLSKLDDCLTRARAAVRDPRARQRVQMMAQGLQYTHMLVDYLATVDRVRRKAGSAPWGVNASPELKEEVRRVAGPKAEALRTFLKDPATSPAVGRSNSYLERALKPDLILTSWTEIPLGSRGVVLTKAQWLKQQGKQAVTGEAVRPDDMPETFDLWVYGNDLDFVQGKPEHTIFAVGPDGKRHRLGAVGTEEHPGDGTNRCYVLRGVRPELLDQGVLHLLITNDPGGPYASRFWAFYLMPAATAVDDDAATSQIEHDLEGVRSRALALTEYSAAGLVSREPAEVSVTLEVAVAK